MFASVSEVGETYAEFVRVVFRENVNRLLCRKHTEPFDTILLVAGDVVLLDDSDDVSKLLGKAGNMGLETFRSEVFAQSLEHGDELRLAVVERGRLFQTVTIGNLLVLGILVLVDVPHIPGRVDDSGVLGCLGGIANIPEAHIERDEARLAHCGWSCFDLRLLAPVVLQQVCQMERDDDVTT